MITFHRYYPSYCSGFDAEMEVEYEFNTIEELQKDSWISYFLTDTPKEVFYKLSISDRGQLMAEYNQGTVWRVVGSISGIELPKWEPIYFEKWPKDPPPLPPTKEEIEEYHRRMKPINDLFKSAYGPESKTIYPKNTKLSKS